MSWWLWQTRFSSNSESVVFRSSDLNHCQSSFWGWKGWDTIACVILVLFSILPQSLETGMRTHSMKVLTCYTKITLWIQPNKHILLLLLLLKASLLGKYIRRQFPLSIGFSIVGGSKGIPILSENLTLLILRIFVALVTSPLGYLLVLNGRSM